MRRLGLAMFPLAAAALAWGLGSWSPGLGGGRARFRVFACVCLGSLAYYARGISVPNYNQVTSCALVAGFGLVLGALSSTGARSLLALPFAGGALSVAMFSKPPAVLAILAAIVSIVVVRRAVGAGAGRVALDLGAFGSGVILGALPTLARRSAAESIELVRAGLRSHAARDYGYGVVESLARYLGQSAEMLLRAAAYAIPALAAGWIAARLAAAKPGDARSERGTASATAVALAALVALLAWDGALEGGRSAARSGRTAAAVVAVVAVGLGLARNHGNATREHPAPPRRGALFVAAALIVAPAIGVLGTNTHFASALVLFFGPWFAIPFVLGSAPGLRGAAACAAPALVAASGAITGPYLSPYGWDAPLTEQRVRVELSRPATDLLIDARTARFLGRLRESALECGALPGADVVALMEMPGFVFALGGVAPGAPLLPPDGRGIREALQIALSRIPTERLNRSFVLLNDHAFRIPGFFVGDRRVPDDYDVCFDRDGPSKFGDRRVRLLKPRQRPAPQ